MALELAIGRWLAHCAHPICVWHRRSSRARALVVTSYFAAGYLSMLIALMLNP